MHGFESGDTVTFKEVKGMTSLNGRQCEIKGWSVHCRKTVWDQRLGLCIGGKLCEIKGWGCALEENCVRSKVGAVHCRKTVWDQRLGLCRNCVRSKVGLCIVRNCEIKGWAVHCRKTVQQTCTLICWWDINVEYLNTLLVLFWKWCEFFGIQFIFWLTSWWFSSGWSCACKDDDDDDDDDWWWWWWWWWWIEHSLLQLVACHHLHLYVQYSFNIYNICSLCPSSCSVVSVCIQHMRHERLRVQCSWGRGHLLTSQSPRDCGICECWLVDSHEPWVLSWWSSSVQAFVHKCWH